MAEAVSFFPHRFEGSFAEFKERQLVFDLTRQLAEAQFARGDRERSERLWQEAAAVAMDPERITGLLFGVADHSDCEEMEAVDRPYRERLRQAARQVRFPLGWMARLRRRPHAGSHRGAPRAGAPVPRGGR
jgi:hypothetical protein